MLNFAIQTARDAGHILAERLGRSRISNKGDIDLVTEADLASEKLIIERIRSHYPRHSILAEESGASDGAIHETGESEWKWIIDPLDGTTNYAHGYPCFCVSIGLERAGRLEIGVVYDPTRDEMFAAERGQGATLNDRTIYVSAISDLGRALVCTGFPYDVRDRPGFARHFTNFTMQTHAVRRDGAAALDLCYVACGRYDGFWEDYRMTSLNPAPVGAPPRKSRSHRRSAITLSGLQKWDVAAGILITREAGGVVMSHHNLELHTCDTDVILVASNGLIQGQMIQLLTAPY